MNTIENDAYEVMRAKAAICGACGGKPSPDEKCRHIGLHVSDPTDWQAVINAEDIGLDYEMVEVWLCSRCTEPLQRLLESVRATLLNINGRSS